MLRLNLNDPGSSDIKYTRSVMPDGQPHIKLHDLPIGPLEVIARITNPAQLFSLCMVGDILKDHRTNLIITYLMGGRMDRPIDVYQPFTLRVVGQALRAAFDHISIFDPHSAVSLTELHAQAITNEQYIESILSGYSVEPTLVAPDQGAAHKVEALGKKFGVDVVYATKVRDSQTGKLSSFKLESEIESGTYLIVDDICDGGGTFIGIGGLLKDAGATYVDLAVSHGIFSKGTTLDNIDEIFTTDSYQSFEGSWHNRLHVSRLFDRRFERELIV